MNARRPDFTNLFADYVAFPDGAVVQNVLTTWGADRDSRENRFIRGFPVPSFMWDDAQGLKVIPLAATFARLFDVPIAYQSNGRSFHLHSVDHHPALAGNPWDRPRPNVEYPLDADGTVLGGTFKGYYRYYLDPPTDFLGPALAQCTTSVYLGSKEQDDAAQDMVIRELIAFAQQQDELDWFVMERVGPGMETDIARRGGLVCGATLGAAFQNDWYFDVRGGKQKDVYPASA